MRLVLLCCCILFFSCSNKKSKQNESTTSDDVVAEDSIDPQQANLFLYHADIELLSKQFDSASPIPNLEAQELVLAINKKYPEIKLEIQDQSNDTLYTFIKDAQYFTQQMGTSGAAEYLANAIINLTRAGGVKAVKIELEEGDHAGPGVWTAKDFFDYRFKH